MGQYRRQSSLSPSQASHASLTKNGVNAKALTLSIHHAPIVHCARSPTKTTSERYPQATDSAASVRSAALPIDPDQRGLRIAWSTYTLDLSAVAQVGEFMAYYLSRRIPLPFDQAVERVRVALGTQGFGVLTDIDVQATIKAKLGADFRRYRILGACNPALAHRALSAEDKIGVILPCNVIVQEHGVNDVEVATIDPSAAMVATGNDALRPLAEAVREKLTAALAAI